TKAVRDRGQHYCPATVPGDLAAELFDPPINRNDRLDHLRGEAIFGLATLPTAFESAIRAKPGERDPDRTRRVSGILEQRDDPVARNERTCRQGCSEEERYPALDRRTRKLAHTHSRKSIHQYRDAPRRPACRQRRDADDSPELMYLRSKTSR